MTIDPNIFIGGLVSVFVAVFGSAGFWQWVSSRSSGEIKTELKRIRGEFESLKQTEDEKEARNSRRRILRFNDELINHVKHSREYFNDILEDVSAYETYCRKNPEFLNSQCTLAIENIERVYRECSKDGTFL